MNKEVFSLNKIRNVLPGIIVCIIIGIVAEVLGNNFSTVGAASFAIFIGIFLGNTFFKEKKSMIKELNLQKRIF